MPSYRLTWKIDIDAVDEVTAAREARRYQLDPGAIVGVFDVTDMHGRTTRVDLDEHDEGSTDDKDPK
jgi:hypothetical protein